MLKFLLASLPWSTRHKKFSDDEIMSMGKISHGVFDTARSVWRINQ
jgi:hypothetical protein